MNKSEYNANYWKENKLTITRRRLEKKEEIKAYNAKYYKANKEKRAKEYQEKKNKLIS